MRRLKALVTALVVTAVASLCLSCGAPGAAPASAGAPAGDRLDFTARTVDGQQFQGRSLAGKRAVLWFWAPWCPTCQAEAPGVAKVAREHPDVTFVGVAAQDQVPAMRAFAQRFGLGFPQLADTDAAIWRRFGVTAQPAFAFVTPDGAVDVVKQALSGSELARRLSPAAG